MATIIIKTNEQRKPTANLNRARILVNYINKKEKCTSTLPLNFLNDETPKQIINELAFICDTADPAHEKKLLQHFVVSIKPDENENIDIEDSQLYDTAKEFLKRLGYEKCPAYLGIHRNTNSPHVHILVARVDPETDKPVKIPLISIAAQKTIAVMSKKYGFNLHARSRYAVENDQLIKLDPPPRDIPQELTDKLKIFCDQHRNDFKKWKWGNLHAELAELGIAMEYRQPKGLFYSLDSEHWTQASFISPELLFSSLEKTLNADSYRKARKSVLDRLQTVRKTLAEQKTDQTPSSSISIEPEPAEPEPAKPLKFKDKLEIVKTTEPRIYEKIKEIMDHPLFIETKKVFYDLTKELVNKIANNILNNDTKKREHKKDTMILNENIGFLKVALEKTEIKKEQFNFNEHLKNKNIYELHKRRILELRPEFITDPYSLNSNIALRLRGTGHNLKESLKIMYAGNAENAENTIANIFEMEFGDNLLENIKEFQMIWKFENKKANIINYDQNLIKYKPQTANASPKTSTKTETLYEYQQQQCS